MESYEHKHQELGNSDSGGGIYKMANDIAKTLLELWLKKELYLVKHLLKHY